MSTKPKNPLLKRVRIHVTQEILDKADPADQNKCYFCHAILPLLNEKYQNRLCVGAYGFSVGGKWCDLTEKAANYINYGIRFKYQEKNPPVPTSFDLWIPRKCLK
jgi:hypothetical protein